MVMEERTLELNVISAQDLKKVKNFGHETCYAVVYIDPLSPKSSRVDKEGGVNPTWNSQFILTCDDALLHRSGTHITVEIYSHGSFSNKLVGTVTISLLDVGEEARGAQPKFMAFEVRRPSGKAKGVLNVSVKVGEKRTISQNAVSQNAGKQQSASAYSAHSGEYKKQQGQGAPPVGYPQTYPPTRSDEYKNHQGQGAPPTGYPQPYPPTRSDKYKMQQGQVPPPTVCPPANPSTTSGHTFDPMKVYPPPGTATSYGASAGNAGSVYPPHRASSDSSSSSKIEEPVMAYPATGYPGAYPPQQYGQQYGSQYAPPQQYYPSAQANDPYNYQQAYYSKPPRRHGGSGAGSGMGMGLLGGALGGLLLGDLIGDMGGF